MNDIGLIGLGVMGSNLILNIYDNYSKNISGFDIDINKINDLSIKIKDKNTILLFNELENFVNSVKTPRKIIILIPSGKYVDNLLDKITPYLSENDTLLDGGNEWYKNTIKRQNLPLILSKNIKYLGCGISGGEKGARTGPCMMIGGPIEGFTNFFPILDKITAKYNNHSCFDYFGNGGIGNYIKMVHNGIEYGIMQLISETYIILKNNYGLTNINISKIFEKWNKYKLNSYLLSITIKILNKKDSDSGICLIDMIKDKIDSKGTGHMTVVDALEKKIPINIIFSALEFRNLSVFREKFYLNNNNNNNKLKKILITDDIIDKLENTLYFSIILTFFQGINLIYNHNLEKNIINKDKKLDLIKLLKVWRNGCIIKCNIINDIINYIEKNKYELNEFVLFIEEKYKLYYEDLFYIICNTKEPIITYSNVLQFCNIIFSKKLESAPLVQAMRDCFGGHMFEFENYSTKFHTNWLD